MRGKTIFLSIALVLAVAAVYWPLGHSEFINYDDHEYVSENPRINHGLTAANVRWALTAIVVSNWHPLTVLSHMLDCELFGVNPRAHHLVNVLFHALNTLLLFQIFRRMTGAISASAMVAALFALHPLHVESVAWISERKDVLSAFFGFLAIWAYIRFCQSKVRTPKHNVAWYLLALVFFACGLMSKPMLVTLPCVLLLLDFWPLNRFSPVKNSNLGGESLSNPQGNAFDPRRFPRLLAEKIPFFALTIASSVITSLTQREAMMPVETLTLLERIFNAAVSYARYLGKTFWPTNLAIFYPHPGAWPGWQVATSFILLIAITSIALWQFRRRPFLAVGWFWFLGTLVPVIGLVQVGSQSMADRYTYIPLIGIFLMLVWGMKGFSRRLPKPLPTVLALTVLVACAVATFNQVGRWKNSITLFSHTLAVTERNVTAHSILGNALITAGRTNEGLQHLYRALEIQPGKAEAHGRIAQLLSEQGNFRESIERYYETLRHNPQSADALNNLAWLLATCPDPSLRNGPEAVRCGELACKLTRWQKTIYIGTLAAAYAEAGRLEDAVRTAERARTLARETGEKDLEQKNSQLLELYRAGKAFHERR